MNFKAYQGAISDIDEQRTVTGYLASFDTIDSDGDIIRKGAFARTIAESWSGGKTRIKYLLDHKKDRVVGVFTVLKEDSIGLYYEAKIGTHSAGEDYYKMLKDGIVDQHSIGYKTVKEEKSAAKENIIIEMKLFEGSGLQFWAANPNTPVTSVKNLSDLDREIGILEMALKNGSYTDETFQSIADRVVKLNQIIEEKREGNLMDIFTKTLLNT